MFILDTDVLSDIQRAKPSAVTWFSTLNVLPVVPGFVVMELIQDAQNSRQVQQIRQLIAPLPIIWPSQSDCTQALAYFTTYHLSHNLGLIDAMIAATATGVAATLCTFNVKHYQIIPALQLYQPYTR